MGCKEYRARGDPFGEDSGGEKKDVCDRRNEPFVRRAPESKPKKGCPDHGNKPSGQT